MPSSKDPLALISQIRFQLDQLIARNAHHEFEHLCRHFSREAITPNILPATGPVSAGGDQGRDFETFTTFINHNPIDSGLFIGTGESKLLVFACTLHKQHGLQAKIKDDVRAICSAGMPYIVYYFSSQNLAISRRHDLQTWCSETFHCKLEIFDAQALSEQLAQPNLFWIAQEYLHVPGELFPPPLATSGEIYNKARGRWLDGSQSPISYADFVDVKVGLRRATFDERLRPDLNRWIGVMENFLESSSDDLRRRATYEVCVATLRGFHNLTPRRALIIHYFDIWGATFAGLAGLRDAVVLLSYCSTASVVGEFDIDTAVLHEWSKALIAKIESSFPSAPGPNALAELLFVRSYAATLPFTRGLIPRIDPDSTLRWWFKLVRAATNAPLFPVEELADLLTVLTPLIGRDERFAKLTSRVDELLENRSQGYLSAEKCRDRAIAYMDAGEPLEAIAELHRVKVKWFTGDTLRGSVLALLSLSDAYLDLGLVYAAKYHALGACFAIASSTDDRLKDLFPSGLFQLGLCAYSGGEWATFAEIVPLFFSAHYQYRGDPDDWGAHRTMQITVVHFIAMRALARALGGQEAVDLVEAPFRALSMPEDLRAEVLEPPVSLEKYESLTPEQILVRASQEVWERPFADCGSVRTYRWRALGISWMVRCDNTLNHIPFAEEFVAVLQIATSDIARYDLCLLPTSVELEVAETDVADIRLVERPDNNRMAYRVEIPQSRSSTSEDMQRVQSGVLAVTTSLLVWCSCLSDREIDQRLRYVFRDGLPSKAFLVRSVRIANCSLNLFQEQRLKRDVPDQSPWTLANTSRSEKLLN